MENVELPVAVRFFTHTKARNYKDGIQPVGEARSASDLWQLLNVKELGIGCAFGAKTRVRTKRGLVQAISVFQSTSHPTWEHESNQNGVELMSSYTNNTCQLRFLEVMWRNIILDIARGDLCANGVRVVLKGANSLRFQVWCPSSLDGMLIMHKLDQAAQVPIFDKPTTPAVTVHATDTAPSPSSNDRDHIDIGHNNNPERAKGPHLCCGTHLYKLFEVPEDLDIAACSIIDVDATPNAQWNVSRNDVNIVFNTNHGSFFFINRWHIPIKWSTKVA